MSHLHTRRARFAVRAAAGLILALPLAGAECADLTSAGASAAGGASYDGTYTLVKVDGGSLPADIIKYDSQNRLVLDHGDWVISEGGKKLTTHMYTFSYVNGVKKTDPNFWPETHYCTIAIKDGSASCTLDSGSSISATIGSNTVTQTNGSHVLEFSK